MEIYFFFLSIVNSHIFTIHSDFTCVCIFLSNWLRPLLNDDPVHCTRSLSKYSLFLTQHKIKAPDIWRYICTGLVTLFANYQLWEASNKTLQIIHTFFNLAFDFGLLSLKKIDFFLPILNAKNNRNWKKFCFAWFDSSVPWPYVLKYIVYSSHCYWITENMSANIGQDDDDDADDVDANGNDGEGWWWRRLDTHAIIIYRNICVRF